MVSISSRHRVSFLSYEYFDFLSIEKINGLQTLIVCVTPMAIFQLRNICMSGIENILIENVIAKITKSKCHVILSSEMQTFTKHCTLAVNSVAIFQRLANIKANRTISYDIKMCPTVSSK